jgi:putative hydroxymethylpyrimidine transport system ATP-binding protein
MTVAEGQFFGRFSLTAPFKFSARATKPIRSSPPDGAAPYTAAVAPVDAPPPGLRFEGLALRYGGRTIFENLDLTLNGGEFVVLLGTSGVGKTSLLKIAAGLARPTEGRVAATDGQPLHHRIAYMGQQDLLYPWLNVIDNVMLGSRLRREKGDGERALHLLGRVGLSERAKALP